MDVIDTPTCRDLARVDHMHGLPSCRVRAGRLGRVTSITGIRAAVHALIPTTSGLWRSHYVLVTVGLGHHRRRRHRDYGYRYQAVARLRVSVSRSAEGPRAA